MEMKVLVVIGTLGKPLDTYVQDFGEMDGYEAALAAYKNLVDTYDRLPPGEYEYEIIALGIGTRFGELIITEKSVDPFATEKNQTSQAVGPAEARHLLQLRLPAGQMASRRIIRF